MVYQTIIVTKIDWSVSKKKICKVFPIGSYVIQSPTVVAILDGSGPVGWNFLNGPPKDYCDKVCFHID